MRRARPRAARIALVSIALALLPSRSIRAEEAVARPADDAAVLLFPATVLVGGGASREDGDAFGTALDEAFTQALEDKGFQVVVPAARPEPGGDVPGEASASALAAGCGWAAAASLALEGDRLAYTLLVYDATDTALAASTGFSAFAGLSALPLMAEGAESVASKLAAYRASAERAAGPQVKYRITLTSPDDGASVRIGEREVGVIEGGKLVLPYIPFERGSRIVITVSAKNRIPQEIPIRLGDEPTAVAAPALRKAAREEILLGTGPGRLLGLSTTYRAFIRPEWSFFFLDAKFFASYDFAHGSVPMLHFESWGGIGSYLLFPPESSFRLGACVGAGYILSASAKALGSAFTDPALIPMQIFFEYRPSRGPAYWLSVRGGYALGGSGLLDRGWIGNGPSDISFGALWRR
jgi:hypothetical protein